MLINDTATMEYEDLPVSPRGMFTSRKLLREGEVLPGVGVYALIAKFHEGEKLFTAPRHKHNFEQIRVVLSGHMDFGPGVVCDPGQVAYFPAGAPYGPERIEGGEQLLLQWGPDWVTHAQNQKAMRALEQKGEFRKGRYHFVDENGEARQIDGSQAVWEWTYGRPQVFVEPRYEAPVKMSPEAFAWVRDGGISTKVMGRFTENDVTFSMLHWDDMDVAHHLEANRTSLMFVMHGSVTIAGTTCGKHATIWSDFGEAHDVVGEPGTEVICIGFPVARDKS
ncbi:MULTISPECIES: hypothetical protein [unclassified Streptomyces]|uniref:hypothetical protein n=1 Tax=unclassified Streptomyces TaxID=2593676 RepID=UPI003D8D4C2B